MEAKCVSCGKLEHQPGQRCTAKNAKCKDSHKIGHFHRARKEPPSEPTLFRAFRTMMTPTLMKMGSDNPMHFPRVNMLKVVNHIEANRGKFNEGKHLKFSIVSQPKGPYNHHIMVRVDTGADINCMNEKTFNELFPEVQLSVCPHEIQNLETQLQTFHYWDSSTLTWSSGVKST